MHLRTHCESSGTRPTCTFEQKSRLSAVTRTSCHSSAASKAMSQLLIAAGTWPCVCRVRPSRLAKLVGSSTRAAHNRIVSGFSRALRGAPEACHHLPAPSLPKVAARMLTCHRTCDLRCRVSSLGNYDGDSVHRDESPTLLTPPLSPPPSTSRWGSVASAGNLKFKY